MDGTRDDTDTTISGGPPMPPPVAIPLDAARAAAKAATPIFDRSPFEVLGLPQLQDESLRALVRILGTAYLSAVHVEAAHHLELCEKPADASHFWVYDPEPDKAEAQLLEALSEHAVRCDKLCAEQFAFALKSAYQRCHLAGIDITWTDSMLTAAMNAFGSIMGWTPASAWFMDYRRRRPRETREAFERQLALLTEDQQRAVRELDDYGCPYRSGPPFGDVITGFYRGVDAAVDGLSKLDIVMQARADKDSGASEAGGEFAGIPMAAGAELAYSAPDRAGEWAKKLGMSRNAFLAARKSGRFRCKNVNRQSICIAIDDLPSHLRPKPAPRR